MRTGSCPCSHLAGLGGAVRPTAAAHGKVRWRPWCIACLPVDRLDLRREAGGPSRAAACARGRACTRAAALLRQEGGGCRCGCSWGAQARGEAARELLRVGTRRVASVRARQGAQPGAALCKQQIWLRAAATSRGVPGSRHPHLRQPPTAEHFDRASIGLAEAPWHALQASPRPKPQAARAALQRAEQPGPGSAAATYELHGQSRCVGRACRGGCVGPGWAPQASSRPEPAGRPPRPCDPAVLLGRGAGARSGWGCGPSHPSARRGAGAVFALIGGPPGCLYAVLVPLLSFAPCRHPAAGPVNSGAPQAIARPAPAHMPCIA